MTYLVVFYLQPLYNKDDFFDSLSYNAIDNDPQSGRIRYSEQVKIDTEVTFLVVVPLTFKIAVFYVFLTAIADFWRIFKVSRGPRGPRSWTWRVFPWRLPWKRIWV